MTRPPRSDSTRSDSNPSDSNPSDSNPSDSNPSEDVTVTLRVEQPGGTTRVLPLQGRWHRGADGVLAFDVGGEIEAESRRIPTAGRVRVWPRWAFGSVVGMHRIALDVLIGRQRLRLDGEVRPPPYFRGVTLPGRLLGRPPDREVLVSIDPVQLVLLWVVLNGSDLPPASGG